MQTQDTSPRVRWAIAVVVAALAAVVLTLLRAPSGFEETDQDPALEGNDLPVTLTSMRPPAKVWEPPASAWVGAIEGGRLRALVGSSLEPSLGVVDVLASGLVLIESSDGRIAVQDPAADARRVASARTATALAADGRTLAKVTPTGSVAVVDLQTGDQLASWHLGLPADTILWSPDSGVLGINHRGGYEARDKTGLLISREAGRRLVAVSSRMALLADAEGVYLKTMAGDTVRAWADLRLGDLSAVGQFDPGGRYVAVRGLGDEGGLEGLWLLSLFGTEREFLSGPFSGFAWAGDGAALYYTTSEGLRARPVDSALEDTMVVGLELPTHEVIDLRVYDHALMPAGTLEASEGGVVTEHRLSSGIAQGPVKAMNPTSGGLQGLSLVVDGSSVKAGRTEETVVDAGDLAVESILGAAGTDRNLFLLTDTGAQGALLQVPLWSEFVHAPYRREGALDTPTVALLGFDADIDSGAVLITGDQTAIAVVVEGSERAMTYMLGIWSWEGASVCPADSLSACPLGELDMRAVTFSPDGNWLLLRDQEGQAHAWSTRGRGVIALGFTIPADVTWKAS